MKPQAPIRENDVEKCTRSCCEGIDTESGPGGKESERVTGSDELGLLGHLAEPHGHASDKARRLRGSTRGGAARPDARQRNPRAASGDLRVLAGMGRFIAVASCAFVVTACSAEGPITSKAEPLKQKVERIEALRKTMPKSDLKNPKQPASPLQIGGAPWTASNTLVVTEVDLNWWSKKAVCTPNFQIATSESSVNCSNEGLGNGSNCVAEIASVLRFGSFRTSDDHRRGAVEQCVAWFSGIRYAFIVHDGTSEKQSTADMRFSGYGVLFDLESGDALGRVELSQEDNDELGGEQYTASGEKRVAITREASSSLSLGKKAIIEELPKTFPATKFEKY